MKSKLPAIVAVLLSVTAWSWFMWEAGHTYKLDVYITAKGEERYAQWELGRCVRAVKRITMDAEHAVGFLWSTQQILVSLEQYRAEMTAPRLAELDQ